MVLPPLHPTSVSCQFLVIFLNPNYKSPKESDLIWGQGDTDASGPNSRLFIELGAWGNSTEQTRKFPKSSVLGEGGTGPSDQQVKKVLLPSGQANLEKKWSSQLDLAHPTELCLCPPPSSRLACPGRVCKVVLRVRNLRHEPSHFRTIAKLLLNYESWNIISVGMP